MTERRQPLNKRYPGQHVIRCRIWFPSGTWVEYEGPISAEGATAIQGSIVNDAPMFKDSAEVSK